MLLVFDIDGVLADTEAIVRRAYRLAGAEMPEGVWGLPWRSWLSDPTAHDCKNLYYASILKAEGLKPLSGGELALRCMDEGVYVRFLTGASLPSARAVLKALGIESTDYVIGWSKNAAEKALILNHYAERYDVRYVDDNEDACITIKRLAPSVHVVHYEGQTRDELEVELWTR